VSAESLFTLVTVAVLPGWLLLMAAPRWRWTARLVGPVLLPALLASLYAWILFVRMPGAPGGFGSLRELRLFFDRPELLLAGWVHYLAFDLFVGSWEVRDAIRSGIPHAWVVPCLALTLLFGPLGLLCYLALRAARTRRLDVD
jgi:hypothetical protein